MNTTNADCRDFIIILKSKIKIHIRVFSDIDLYNIERLKPNYLDYMVFALRESNESLDNLDIIGKQWKDQGCKALDDDQILVILEYSLTLEPVIINIFILDRINEILTMVEDFNITGDIVYCKGDSK